MKTKIITLTFLTACALSLVPTSLAAEDMPPRGPIPFSIYDANEDGSISEKEFNDPKANRMLKRAASGKPMGNAPTFSLFDINSDGKLSKIELLEGQSKQREENRKRRAAMQKFKMNKNSQSRGNRMMPTFERCDLNGDGYITQEEMDKARAKRAEKKLAEGKMMRNSSKASKFSDIDSDGNGKITKDEFLANQAKKQSKR